jgi:alpha,alpha-trehalase
VNGWAMTYEGFEPEQEGLREALCAVGNGYFVTRGAAPESSADDVHYPGTYLAGGYDRLATEIAGRTVENEDLVNLPNWLPLTFRFEDGDWLDLRAVELDDYAQELDLRKGVLTRRFRFRDGAGRVTGVTQRRLVHMREPHLAALETTIVPESWSGRVRIRSALDGRVENAGVARYRSLRGDHLVPLETAAAGEEGVSLVVETRGSRLRVAEAARTRLLREGEPVAAERELVQEAGYVAHELAAEVAEGEQLTVEKVVALYTSRDRGTYEPHHEARRAIAVAGSFDELLAEHVLAWDHLWRRFDITLDGAERPQTVLRLHVFHLLQTVSPNTIDLDAGVPARGLHGEAYRGHVFWDELFIFPFLNYRLPALTRSLLMYRHRRLPEARRAAREQGYDGALFPWQSGSNGREESQTLHLNPRSGRWLPDNSHLQQHIDIAVAFNVWQYYEVTRDTGFLRYYGAELIVEIARFWSSIAEYNRSLDRYEITRVMGPDEYHDGYPDADEPGLANNAYTNVMAAWVLARALELEEILPDYQREELFEQLGLTRDELARFEDVSRRLHVPFHDGVISQFDGYEDLEELDWERYRREYGDIHRLDRILEAEGDTPNRYKVSKQADVLMLFYLLSPQELVDLFHRLGYDFDPETDIPRNVDYYLERTSHGSTLSGVVHSWVLARSDPRRSWALFLKALESDVSDVQGGTTAEGIHLGAMAGTVDLIQRGYTGIEARGGVLRLDPLLPAELASLAFEIHYRGHRLAIELDDGRLRVTSRPSDRPPIEIGLAGEVIELHPGATEELALAAT